MEERNNEQRLKTVNSDIRSLCKKIATYYDIDAKNHIEMIKDVQKNLALKGEKNGRKN